MGKKNLSLVAMVLVVVGALNWGLVGAFGYNLVDELAMLLFSDPDWIEWSQRVVYSLVGLAGVFQLVELVESKK